MACATIICAGMQFAWPVDCCLLSRVLNCGPGTNSAASDHSIELMNFKNGAGLNLIFLLASVTPILMVLSRNIATPVFAAMAIGLVVLAWRGRGSHFAQNAVKSITACKAIWVCIALLLIMAVTVLWSPAFKRSIESIAHLAGNGALLFLVIVGITSQRIVPRLNWHITGGLLAATSVLIIEEITFGSPVRAMLGGAVEPFRLNRSAVAAVLYLPFLVYVLPSSRPGVLVGIVVTLLIGWAALVSDSETAKLGFFIILATWAATLFARRVAIWLFGGLAVASLIGMPVVAPVIMDYVPGFIVERVHYGTLGIRAEIWSAHAELLRNAPVFGHGMEASFVATETYKNTSFPNNLLGHGHPHNFAIQVWYELGAVGVALFSVLIFLYFMALRSVPVRFLPGILSTSAAVWIVSMVSHGAWQAWWWSLVGIVAVLWVLVIRSETADGETQTL